MIVPCNELAPRPVDVLPNFPKMILYRVHFIDDGWIKFAVHFVSSKLLSLTSSVSDLQYSLTTVTALKIVPL